MTKEQIIIRLQIGKPIYRHRETHEWNTRNIDQMIEDGIARWEETSNRLILVEEKINEQ